MALPQQLMVSPTRMSNATLIDAVDDQVGLLEQAIANILGIPQNTNITAAPFAISAAGVLTIAQGLIAGSLGAPAVFPNGDSNTGIAFTAADTIDLSAGAVRVAQFVTAASGVNYLKFTPAATGAGPRIGAEGSDTHININYDTKGNQGKHVWRSEGGATTLMTLDPNGQSLLIGTTVTTGLVSGSVGTKRIQFINQAQTDFANFGMARLGDSLDFAVPSANELFYFEWAAVLRFAIQSQNAGAGLLFMTESSADHAAPAANQCVLYTKDNGSGKTQLMARFNTGAVQQVAIQP